MRRVSPKIAGKLAEMVIAWFRANARDLPWRRTKDPYAVWISEVMLQQTQVKTVIPYWERWMKAFPTVSSLAEASEERGLKLWEGLGYYSRARNLQKAARVVASKFGGSFPRAFEEVLELPGIGRYTAGAICSIAYGQAQPILDGNVMRVLTRVFEISGSIKDRETQSQLWDLSESIVRRAADCSALNQGLMELGATVCLPREPRCLTCPLRANCSAYRKGEVAKYPERGERMAMRERQFAAFLISRGRSVLVRKREAGIVNGGLWEFPNVELKAEEGLDRIVSSLGIQVHPAATIKHTITRNRITLRAFAGRANGEGKVLARKLKAEWRAIADLESLPFSSAHAKLRAQVQRVTYPVQAS